MWHHHEAAGQNTPYGPAAKWLCGVEGRVKGTGVPTVERMSYPGKPLCLFLHLGGVYTGDGKERNPLKGFPFRGVPSCFFLIRRVAHTSLYWRVAGYSIDYDDPLIVSLTEKYKATPTQIIFTIIVPKSENSERQNENIMVRHHIIHGHKSNTV